MPIPSLLLLFTLIALPSSAAPQTQLTGHAAELYHQAQGGRWFGDAAKLKPDILPTSDGQSFLVVWKATKAPKRWIVSLHGTQGFATDDFAIWHPHLKDRDVGLVCAQWWLGAGDAPTAYYTPVQIYHEIDLALQKLGVQPGSVMLHGFSRGSANLYAVAALDAGRGKRYFSLAVASSGGVALDYPPTRAILNGDYGKRPLQGTRWVTAAGGRDTHPDRDGIAGMKRTAAWLKEQGATVAETIEDPDEGHGALQRNAKNARRVLDLFLSYPPHWWSPAPKEGAPVWEILPQEAGPGEVILSKWKYTREQVAQLTSFEAKSAGTLAEANMEKMGITWVTFEGQRIEYRASAPGEHYRLVAAATPEKVRQNPYVKRILLATGDLVLRPDHHQEPNAPAAWRYFEILTQIRSALRTQERPR